MPWYRHTGSIAVAVQRIDGEVVALRPRDQIEAHAPATARLVAQGILIECAPPPPAPPIAQPRVAEKPVLADPVADDREAPEKLAKKPPRRLSGGGHSDD